MMASDAPRLIWRIGVAMAERDIRTVRELRRRLRDAGYEISEPQLGRLRKQLPRQLDTRFLAALCVVLQVQPGELIRLPGAPVSGPLASPIAVDAQRAADEPSGTGVSTAAPPPPAMPPGPRTFPMAGPRVRPMY